MWQRRKQQEVVAVVKKAKAKAEAKVKKAVGKGGSDRPVSYLDTNISLTPKLNERKAP